MKLKDKVALVTGASRGIGRAIALEFAKEGAKIAFTFAKNKELADSLVQEIEATGGKALAYQMDTRDFEAAKALIPKVKESFGGLDILVNNAGITKDKALMLMEREDWQEVIDTNLGGVFNLTRSAIVTFMKQKSGNIINISSASGIIGLPRQVNYSASKAGIIGFTKALAKEVAGFNIRVNALAPGFIDTDMVSALKDDFKNEVLKHIPLARFGKAEEVAKSAVFLASNESQYITGQVIVVDGGLVIR